VADLLAVVQPSRAPGALSAGGPSHLCPETICYDGLMNTAMAQKILREIQYATIATVCADGAPWNTPVFCACDEAGQIYWSSRPDAVHSRNLQRDPRAFIVIYNSKAGEGEGVGLYLDAKVEMIEDPAEIKTALKLLGNRRGKPFKYPAKFIGEGPQRIYRATAHKAWTNGADLDQDGDFIRDYRVELGL